MLLNGFGEHNIQGIGDKHIPLIHNVMNTDVAARRLRPRDRPARRAVRDGRRAASTWRGAAASRQEVLAQLPSLGLSSICNILGAIKTAKLLRPRPGRRCRHGRDGRGRDVRQRARARAPELLPRRLRRGAAGEVFGEHLLGATTDHLRELTHEDRERIFNLGYFTWVEQQGVPIADFEARREPDVLARRRAPRSRAGTS